MKTDILDRLNHSIRNLKKADELLRKCLKLKENIEKNAVTIEDIAGKARRELGSAGQIETTVRETDHFCNLILAEAKKATEKYKNNVTGELYNLLGKEGIELTGNFPKFRCSFLSLEFIMTGKREVKIYFGPGIAVLGKCSVVPEEIADLIMKILKKFESESISQNEFLRELKKAYENALKKTSKPEGAPVPLPSVLFEIAIMRQKAGFFSDPVRENFASYGRIQFAYDLFRLKNRIIDGFELKLLVANMLQTKHDDAHIWIPSSSGDDGTHFASVYFSRA